MTSFAIEPTNLRDTTVPMKVTLACDVPNFEVQSDTHRMLTLPWIGLVTFGAGNLFFPISYIFGDVLTEVYGYARSRRVVWAGFGALLFASLMSWIVLKLPPDPLWPHQPGCCDGDRQQFLPGYPRG